MTAANVIEAADLFCGAGGSSTGMLEALTSRGYTVSLVAVNHWEVAVATHQANHPGQRHACTDLSTTKPVELVPSGHLDLLWASPECTYHSRARGGKPISDQQRMSPWLINRWLTDLDVDRLIVENVPEFIEWGPLTAEGKPDPAHKREYFEAWVRSLWMLGYDVEWRLLNAADYGEATTRVRFFLQARRRGQGIVWPNATHCRRGSKELFGGRRPWRPAADVIDWSKPGPSLFERSKPLSVKTRLRMARGFQKFGGELAPYFIALLDLPTEHATAFAKVAQIIPGDIPRPFVEVARENNVPKSTDDPLGTITTMPGMRLVQPRLEPFILANREHAAARSTEEPTPTATTTTGGGITLTTPEAFLLAQASGGEARPVSDPVPTIVTDGAISAVRPAVIQYNRTADAQSVDEPLRTVTTKDRFGVASPLLLTLRGTASDQINSTAKSVDEPVGAITAGGGHHGLATPLAVPCGPDAEARSVEEPLPTILTKDRLAVATPQAFMLPGFGEKAGQQPRVHAVNEPAPTITGQGHQHLVQPMVLDYERRDETAHSPDDPLTVIHAGGNKHALVNPVVLNMGNVGREDDGMSRSAGEPLPTLTTRNNVAVATGTAEPAVAGAIDPRRLVTIDGQTYLLDIRFRMLQPGELAQAMGFPKSYRFVGTKADVTKQIGNAVSRRTARALVAAAFAEAASEGVA